MKIHGYLELARQVSKNSSHKFQIGCVIVKGNRILSVGWNQIRHCKVGKRWSNYDCSLHAERHACSKVDKEKLKGSTIFIFRSYADGRNALAFPCEDCYSMLEALAVRRIVYSTSSFPYYNIERIR